MKPVVAIVGRANVGKSTLFNRLTEGRHAIVEDTPGVTRDRLYRDAEWLNREFTLIDTGGIEFNQADGHISAKVYEQVELAIEEAAVIIFVVDGKAGINEDDKEIARILQKSKKPLVLAVNKLDNYGATTEHYEFFELGLGEPYPFSALHGINTGDLLDAVVAELPSQDFAEDESDRLRVTLIGRPNVGKSSLVNRLLGQDRVIVSDQPGTTRDAIDTPLTADGKEYLLIDTAGMRKKARVNEPTERYSVARGLKAIDNSDVVLLVIDATSGITEQDQRIAGYAHEAGKGMLLVVNKWDLPEKDDKTMKKFEQEIKEKLPFADYLLSIFVSAKTGQRIDKILPLADFIAEQQSRRIPTSQVNEVLREAVLHNPPPADKGRRAKIFYASQVGIKPPKFVIFVNDPEILHFSYERYIENKMREAFGFAGTPVWLMWRKREKEER